ncbi:coiled-coil domain-containing protein 138 [Echeneis naucrates]|uniref:coiled-coil domain-containing protein 138 n=1 Tax=Echeneis naucrates TaxID=173247 RepID=UPI0011145E31|nr:coiled-coil domain-containing protein 138 [Echeneis naucrates]
MDEVRQSYLEERKQFPPSEDMTRGASDIGELILGHRRKQSSKEWKCNSKALNELFTAVTNHPEQSSSGYNLHGSNEDLSGNITAAPFQHSQVLLTETDVTLPSGLDGSPASQEHEINMMLLRAHHFPDSGHSSSLELVKVYQEMMTIFEQLKTERQSQQQWVRELNEREQMLKQQEEAFRKLAGMEDLLHSRILAVEEKHRQELRQLEHGLREKSKESKRLKSSFDTIKELNENLRKQLNATSEQNKKLESQSKRVQARLENLQRKYEHSIASRGSQKESVKSTDFIKLPKKGQTAASGKSSNKDSSSPTQPKLLALLLDWVLDEQMFSSVTGKERKSEGQGLPLTDVLSERCFKVLPLLADQLYHTPLSEPDLLVNLLRLIHWVLRCLDNNAQHVALSATLRRIGEEVSKPAVHSIVSHSEDSDLPKSCSVAAGNFRNWPLYQSPCPHTRILSNLIILRTVTKADVLAQALDSLRTELMTEESRGCFIHYGGVSLLLMVLRTSRGGLQATIDILMQLTEQSRYLNPFLEACSCEDFFRTASQLLKHSRLELPLIEKLSILLQKLSSIRKNRRLFELSSLHHQIQELYHKTNHTHAFLCLNFRSILLNLK